MPTIPKPPPESPRAPAATEPWSASPGGPDDRPVTAADLELGLARLLAETPDPRAGIFGPQSKVWEVNREAVLFLGGARAALLQLAHPYVAEAIRQHSDSQHDPFGRFQRTFYRVFAMVYGDLDSALGSARAVHTVHTRINGRFEQPVGRYRRGDRYRANEPSPLMWVHSTLWETSVRIYETLVRELSPAEREQYYRETGRFARLFGIDPASLPPDWGSFLAYNRKMWESEELAVGDAAREIAELLLQPRRGLPGPVARWLRTMTAGLLPEPIRDGFGFRFAAKERRTFESSLRHLRRALPLLPRRLRYVPPYLEAQRRLAGKRSRDRIGELLTRLYVGKGGTAIGSLDIAPSGDQT